MMNQQDRDATEQDIDIEIQNYRAYTGMQQSRNYTGRGMQATQRGLYRNATKKLIRVTKHRANNIRMLV